MQMTFSEMVSDNLCRNTSVVQTNRFISFLGDSSQAILKVKKRDVEVLGWCGYMCLRL
jgi:hypothetical protein